MLGSGDGLGSGEVVGGEPVGVNDEPMTGFVGIGEGLTSEASDGETDRYKSEIDSVLVGMTLEDMGETGVEWSVTLTLPSEGVRVENGDDPVKMGVKWKTAGSDEK